MLQTLADTFRAYWFWLKTSAQTNPLLCRQIKRDQRSILMLATYLPPVIYGGGYRPLSLLRYAKKNGWNVTAVSRDPGEKLDRAGEYLVAQLPKAVRLIGVAPSALRPSWRWFPRVSDSFLNALQIVATVTAERVAAPAAIVATGPAFENFVAGYYLARKFGSKLILDYRDEWTQCPFDFVNLGNCDLYWEKRCLYAADGVVFTTGPMLRHTTGILAPDRRDRAYVVRNGWEPADFCIVPEVDVAHTESSKTTLSFIGWGGNIHPLAPFLADLSAAIKRRTELADTLVLQFIGHKSGEWSRELAAFPYPSMLRLLPHLPKDEAAQKMRESDALLIFSSENLAHYMPGKLYDYIASKRPVIIHGAAGEASTIVEDLGVGRLVTPGDVTTLIELIDAARANRLGTSSDKVRTWLEQHTREALAERFFQFIEEVVRGHVPVASPSSTK